MGIAAGHGAEHTEGGGDGVAAGVDGQLDDVLRVEIDRVGRKARRRRVLDALVDGQDRDVAGAAHTARVEEHAEVAQHGHGPVRQGKDPVDEVGAGQDEVFPGHALALVGEQRLSFVTEQLVKVHSKIAPNLLVLVSTRRAAPLPEREPTRLDGNGLVAKDSLAAGRRGPARAKSHCSGWSRGQTGPQGGPSRQVIG